MRKALRRLPPVPAAPEGPFAACGGMKSRPLPSAARGGALCTITPDYGKIKGNKALWAGISGPEEWIPSRSGECATHHEANDCGNGSGGGAWHDGVGLCGNIRRAGGAKRVWKKEGGYPRHLCQWRGCAYHGGGQGVCHPGIQVRRQRAGDCMPVPGRAGQSGEQR